MHLINCTTVSSQSEIVAATDSILVNQTYVAAKRLTTANSPMGKDREMGKEYLGMLSCLVCFVLNTVITTWHLQSPLNVWSNLGVIRSFGTSGLVFSSELNKIQVKAIHLRVHQQLIKRWVVAVLIFPAVTILHIKRGKFLRNTRYVDYIANMVDVKSLLFITDNINILIDGLHARIISNTDVYEEILTSSFRGITSDRCTRPTPRGQALLFSF